MPRRTFRLIGARRVIVMTLDERGNVEQLAFFDHYTERAVTVPAPEPEPRWTVGGADGKPPDVRRYELGFAPAEELDDGR